MLLELSRRSPIRPGEPPLESVLEQVLSNIFERDLGLADALFGRAEEIWALRHALSEGVKNAGKLVAVDMGLERGKLLPACAVLREEIKTRWDEAIVCDFGHIGDGGVHFNTVMPKSTPPEIMAEMSDWIIDTAVRRFGATFSSEHGVGRKNQHYYDLYTPTHTKTLAKGLKSILAPGLIGAADYG